MAMPEKNRAMGIGNPKTTGTKMVQIGHDAVFHHVVQIAAHQVGAQSRGQGRGNVQHPAAAGGDNIEFFRRKGRKKVEFGQYIHLLTICFFAGGPAGQINSIVNENRLDDKLFFFFLFFRFFTCFKYSFRL